MFAQNGIAKDFFHHLFCQPAVQKKYVFLKKNLQSCWLVLRVPANIIKWPSLFLSK